jgi:dipeptidyl aminopeptidase/acylaminoacyl peptidase
MEDPGKESPMTVPCGSWKSPITAELITAHTITLGQTWIDGSDVYWVEGRPSEGGRNALRRLSPGSGPVDCLSVDRNVRTRVHEYGGGAYAVFGEVIFFVDFKDQHLYRQVPNGSPEVLTPTEGHRFADFELDKGRQRLLCVREDHTGQGEAINALVAVPLAGRGDEIVLAEGYSFYSTPRLRPDGSSLAWLCWNHPNMPWDGTELWVAEIRPDGTLGQGRRIAGGPEESIFQPEWSPGGVLHFVSDRSGWWNLYRLGEEVLEPICPLEAEFGEPQWIFGQRTYAFVSEHELLCAHSCSGTQAMARLDTQTGRMATLPLPYTTCTDLHVSGGLAVFKAGSATQPFSVLRLDLTSDRIEVLQRAFEPTLDPAYLSQPRTIEFPTENDLTAHGIFYPPANRDCAIPAGEKPPLIVMSHGGPTSAASSVLSYQIQFWTSRGFAALDVDYGGSIGYGRDYRLRLNGQWGIVDVDDCCNGARWLAAQGWVDARRMAIRGGSAGGYTTLAALAFKNVFSAGASHYGVSDLEALAKDTHKFESRYLDTLVGPYPARKDLYEARSPIHHVEKLVTPLILLQGSEDPVVPPAQSEVMFEALRAKGVPVAYLLFQGEQHGFRKAENIQRALQAELYFYSRIFKFDLAEGIEPVQICNL